MNSTIALFLLLLLSSPAYAAPSAMADDASNCPKARATVAAANTQEADSVSTVPAAATRATPVRNRAPTQRTVSPRWHSMLPGMFR